MKPTKKQLISVLENLESAMTTSEIMLSRYGRDDKARELGGARQMVKEWIEGIKG